MDNKIIMYTADYCNHCKVVKMYLDAMGLDYELRDVADDKYKDEMSEMGFMTIPVLGIDGEYKAVNSSNFKEFLSKKHCINI